ncbi:hypothetical protein ACJX0J_032881, partial [Zea mays]
SWSKVIVNYFSVYMLNRTTSILLIYAYPSVYLCHVILYLYMYRAVAFLFSCRLRKFSTLREIDRGFLDDQLFGPTLNSIVVPHLREIDRGLVFDETQNFINRDEHHFLPPLEIIVANQKIGVCLNTFFNAYIHVCKCLQGILYQNRCTICENAEPKLSQLIH